MRHRTGTSSRNRIWTKRDIDLFVCFNARLWSGRNSVWECGQTLGTPTAWNYHKFWSKGSYDLDNRFHVLTRACSGLKSSYLRSKTAYWEVVCVLIQWNLTISQHNLSVNYRIRIFAISTKNRPRFHRPRHRSRQRICSKGLPLHTVWEDICQQWTSKQSNAHTKCSTQIMTA